MRLTTFVTACACLLLAACGSWKSGQGNSAQANISNDSRPPATADANAVGNGSATNGMLMLAVALPKDRALQIMHVRHEGMESIGNAFKTLHREIESTSPFAPTVRSSAAQIADLSQKASGWFPAGTGPDVAKTRAKADIWQNQQDFASKLHSFQVAAQAMNAAAAANDINAMKARFADLGGACKACHDKYRAEEQH